MEEKKPLAEQIKKEIRQTEFMIGFKEREKQRNKKNGI